MGLSVKDLLEKTSPPERVKKICLNGSLRSERDALRDELDEITGQSTGKMGADPRAAELAERIAAIEAQMAEEAVAFRFRGVSRWRLKEIQQKFPTEEKYAEWDVEAGATTLISECLVDPS
jgi:small-conductance mechanosensitive channel